MIPRIQSAANLAVDRYYWRRYWASLWGAIGVFNLATQRKGR